MKNSYHNRRFAAIEYLGWKKVRVKIRGDLWYSKDKPEFLKLLVSCNTQRDKTTTEQLREGVVNMADNPWHEVYDYRKEAVVVNAESIALYGKKTRSKIRDKIGLKDAIIKVVNDAEDDWPISDRKVFYLLLNVEGLFRNDRLKTPFENSPECYNDTTNMLTRLRLDGSIDFEAIGDETRPVTIWRTSKSVGPFIANELRDLFSGYWRDLQQSQPCWIELLVEKNTIATSLREIAGKYTIPMTSGRGYSSLPPRKEMVDRFEKSGRKKLVLITVSDCDPEGCDIPNSFGLSLIHDFDLKPEQLQVIQAALTFKQAEQLSLHKGQLAKEDGKRYDRYLAKYGERCWELESIPTDKLREIVEDAIRSVLNMELFNGELEKEQAEQEELSEHRMKLKDRFAEWVSIYNRPRL